MIAFSIPYVGLIGAIVGLIPGVIFADAVIAVAYQFEINADGFAGVFLRLLHAIAFSMVITGFFIGITANIQRKLGSFL